MPVAPTLPDQPRCPVCCATIISGAPFCTMCGARLEETPAEELRGVNYLLSELGRWEAASIITNEQAATLRERYERRRDYLRTQIAPDDAQAKTPALATEETSQAVGPLRAAGPEKGMLRRAPATQQQRSRTLVETLTDPHNLRLLLYTGAAMIVVSVVLWLRDVLYLKLQEPVVQAGLLATVTLIFTVSGWFTILRTRQRLTGRAFTLIGSLLVPVNFWFLVRSGLIASHGRAWMVCAFSAMLYALTAVLLREKLYVYLASVAIIATAWALVFRTEREAFGLYALALMICSLVFLHLSRLFPPGMNDEPLTIGEGQQTLTNDTSSMAHRSSSNRWSAGLWSVPLVRVALSGATLSLMLYLPLRLGQSSSLSEGIFRWRANTYDASMAILLCAVLAYVMWFTGRYIYMGWRILLYTLGALALCWTELLALDGFRLSGSTHLFALTLTTLALAFESRFARDAEIAAALHRAGVIAGVLLTPVAFGVFYATTPCTMMHSVAVAFLAVAFAVLSAPRFCRRIAQVALAHASAVFASAACVIALGSTTLRPETIFAMCAVLPFALYAGAQFVQRRQGEMQLTAPFARTADAEFILLLLWASTLAFFLHLATSEFVSWRASMFCTLSGAVLYGAWRARARDANFGAGLVSVAVLVMVAASVDALKNLGLLPGAWPAAAFVTGAALLIPGAHALRLSLRHEPTLDQKILDQGDSQQMSRLAQRSLSPEMTVWLVSDLAVIICALLWLAHAFYFIHDGGFSASVVLLLALLYWSGRALKGSLSWAAHLAFIHAGAFLLTLLIALRVDAQWFAFIFALMIPALIFALGRYARARGIDWLAAQALRAATVAATMAFVAALLQAAPHLRAGDTSLLAPCLTTSVIALLCLIMGLLAVGPTRVTYFRAFLFIGVISFALGCLRVGFDPLADIEIYTSPVAVALLIIAYLSVRREWAEYERDTNLLLWLGSVLLCVPLLLHALEYRLLLDVPAPWRDLGVLCVSLALILFGVIGRLRAPVMTGMVTLLIELAALALTSVEWMQVPLKVYLAVMGSLFLLVGWMLGFRREQLMEMRERLNAYRARTRARFGKWR